MSNIMDFLPCQEAFKAKGPHEWAGPCPDCGGRDRFLVWPARPRGGAFLCRAAEPRATAFNSYGSSTA